jgi:LytR cell envelope-related transcriptional attenuator
VPPRRPSTGRPRRAAYIAVAVVLLIVLVVVIVAATSGGGSEKKAPNTIAPAQQAGSGKTKHRKAPAPVPRGQIKVAVLNGTTQAGLAAQIGDQVTASGFQKGQVTNAPDQQAQQTVVYYTSGQKKAAQEVAKVVKAGSVQPIDPDTQAVAGGDAKVVVLVGADKT